jgi:hypothetical protein
VIAVFEKVRSTFGEDDLPVGLMLVAFAGFACIVPAQADTFYHLRSGQEMWQTGSLIRSEPFSWTHNGRPLANHWWLTQLIFYGLHAAGGPLLLTLVGGCAAFTALVSSWRLITGSTEVRLLALIGYALTLPEWSVRPQVFSLLMTVIAIRLIISDRSAALLVLLVVWANMHAIVVLGIAIAAVPLLDAVLWDRGSFRRAALVAGAAIATPLATPFALDYWPSLLATVESSRALGLQEYRSAFNLEPLTLLFWLVTAALGVGIFRQRHELRRFARGTRLLVLASVVLLPTAVTSVRNIPFFVLAALPALFRLFPAPARGKRRSASTAAWGMVSAAAFAAAFVVVLRWSDGGQQLGWRPFSAQAIASIKSCDERMYNGLYEGGQLIWFVPERPVFIDGRVEAYPRDFMLQTRQADVDGDYLPLFSKYDIECALTHPGTALFTALQRDGTMRLKFSDPQWAVFGN